jgi:multimeric flavodoxin WrbA
MKLLGLACGSPMGNSEILLKEAMMGVEEARKDVEVEIIRLLDLDIKPCKRCKRCPQREGGECIQKDDSPFVQEKYLECDGLIISSPVYGTIPPGEVLVLAERAFGARADVAGAIERKKMEGREDLAAQGFWGARTWKAPPVDERVFKPRVGALIGVGGASSYEWVHLTLPLLHNVMLPLQVAVVDHLQVRRASFPGTVLLQDEVMKRARKLGRNVAEALGTPFDEVKWRGDEPGSCPVCHSELFIVGNKMPVMCAICGIYGTLKVDGDKITVHFTKEEQKKSRVAIEGKRLHQVEIQAVSKELLPRLNEIPAKLEKYKSYKKTPIKPPSKTRKKLVLDKKSLSC